MAFIFLLNLAFGLFNLMSRIPFVSDMSVSLAELFKIPLVEIQHRGTEIV